MQINHKDKPALIFRLNPGNRLTLPYLLRELEKSGQDDYAQIRIISGFQGIRDFVSAKKHGLILYSFMTPHLPEVKREIDWIRLHRSKGLLTIAGGPHTAGNPLSSLKLGFDLAFAGAAETGLSGLIEKYLQNRLPESPAILRSAEINSLNGDFPFSKHIKTIPPIEITRGCYWNCKFCQTSCVKAIHRPLESVKAIFPELKKRGVHRRLNFISPSAFEYAGQDGQHLNFAAIEELLSFCRKNGTEFLEYGIFPSEARPNTFRPEFVELIARYCNNKKITIGAQSGSERILKSMRRGHTVEHATEACKMAAAAKLQPMVDIIMGFPGENHDDRWDTLEFMKKIHRQSGARIHVHHFLPLSGTDFQNSEPTKLDYRTIDELTELEKGGVCTNWWRTGRKLSFDIVQIRDEIEEREIDFQEIVLSK